MSKVIYKYSLNVVDSQVVRMPIGAEIISAQTQRDIPCIWALVTDELTADYEDRTIRIVGTGHPVDFQMGTYCGTFQLQGGAFVGHVFEEKTQ